MTPSPNDTARYLQPDKPSKLMALALMLSAHTASVTLPEYGRGHEADRPAPSPVNQPRKALEE